MDELRRADEGDVEEQHQDRDAAHDLDVEGRDLAHDAKRETRPSATRRPSAAASAKATIVTQSVTRTPRRSAEKIVR